MLFPPLGLALFHLLGLALKPVLDLLSFGGDAFQVFHGTYGKLGLALGLLPLWLGAVLPWLRRIPGRVSARLARLREELQELEEAPFRFAAEGSKIVYVGD